MASDHARPGSRERACAAARRSLASGRNIGQQRRTEWPPQLTLFRLSQVADSTDRGVGNIGQVERYIVILSKWATLEFAFGFVERIPEKCSNHTRFRL